ncbi:unnamed protein product [Heligmosomoides polygyrus]|uniref:Uncharacterized protein n=1 Tax=Heligmosomoides polygyrus TaxID=6339 RepID=A0A183FS99_HELPZ|nr:unnamed protein product [Heligmosomoides polygyrus]
MSDLHAALAEMEQGNTILPIIRVLSVLIDKLDSLHNMVACSTGRLDRIEAALQVLRDRTLPKSPCIFCTIAENPDSHHSGRCPRFPDPVSRAVQASKMGLCECCLKPAHDN